MHVFCEGGADYGTPAVAEGRRSAAQRSAVEADDDQHELGFLDPAAGIVFVGLTAKMRWCIYGSRIITYRGPGTRFACFISMHMLLAIMLMIPCE